MLPLAVAMCLPAVADAAANNPDWQVFLTAAVFTLFVGGTLALSSRGAIRTITPRQGFVLTLVWSELCKDLQYLRLHLRV